MHVAIIAVLAVVQGAAEILPVSSSAHVIIVEKIFGLDPTSPEMTFLLVMLHTGKMLAYATVTTGIVGLALQYLVEEVILGGKKGAAVENLFGDLWVIASALAV